MPFDRILVAIDGSQGGQNARSNALGLAQVTRASLSAFAVEGPLPAYAATVGEVDDVKREKDSYVGADAASAREQAEAAGVDFYVGVRAGHAAELITRHARDIDADLVVVGHKGHFLNDYLLGSTADRVAPFAFSGIYPRSSRVACRANHPYDGFRDWKPGTGDPNRRDLR